jgi:hypothetical protein
MPERHRQRVPRVDGAVAAAAPAILRIAAHARQIVPLTSPHRTPRPFFQQPNGLRSFTQASSS